MKRILLVAVGLLISTSAFAACPLSLSGQFERRWNETEKSYGKHVEKDWSGSWAAGLIGRAEVRKDLSLYVRRTWLLEEDSSKPEWAVGVEVPIWCGGGCKVVKAAKKGGCK